MSNFSYNSSATALNPSGDITCDLSTERLLLLLDVLTFVVGQPAVAALLWLSFTFKKTRYILNCNMALFNNVQYLMSVTHMCVYKLCPREHLMVLKFLINYAQAGGPTSMFCICMQRYVAVVHPTRYRTLVRYWFQEVCVLVVWTTALLSPSFYLFLMTIPADIRRILTNIPFILIIYMIWMVVKANIKVGKRLKRPGPEGDKPNRTKMKAVRAIRATSAITMGLYLPALTLGRVRHEVYSDCVLLSINVMLLALASLAHPLGFLASNTKLLQGRGKAPDSV